MLPSQNCFTLIKLWEKFRPTAYRPTRKDVWTIGWGHTLGVKEGDTCTTEQGQEWLEQDVREAVVTVNTLVTVPMSQNMFDALVSFCFNAGRSAFRDSTLLVKLNTKDYGGATAELLRWTYQGGDELRGLEYRRAAEKLMADLPDNFAPTPRPDMP